MSVHHDTVQFQQPKKLTHLKTIKMKPLRNKVANKKGQDLKCPRIQLPNGAVLINRKRHRLPLTKEYILEEYHNVFSTVGTLPGKEYHITLKDYIPVQCLLDQYQSGSKWHTKRALMTMQ